MMAGVRARNEPAWLLPSDGTRNGPLRGVHPALQPERLRHLDRGRRGRRLAAELRPYYEQIEQDLPVAGERWPGPTR